MPTNAEVGKVQLGVTHMTPLQGCALNSIKMRNMGKAKTKKSKNPEAEERKLDPGKTPRNPHSQSCIRESFMTEIMNEWALSTTEDNLATTRDPISVQAWKESSMHGIPL